jgi:hypothetical protein
MEDRMRSWMMLAAIGAGLLGSLPPAWGDRGFRAIDIGRRVAGR